MMHVLAFVPGGIGDQLLFFPTLDSLSRAYPGVEIDVVVEPRSLGAYRVSRLFHDRSLQTIPFDFKDRNGLADWSNLLGIIRDREYDCVLSLGRSWGVGLMLWLTGIAKRVGYGGGVSEMFLTDPVPLKPEQYAAQMYHDLLQGLTVNATCGPIEVALLKEDLEWAKAEQQRLGVAESGYILIHGGSSQLARAKGIDKIYPVANWQRIIQEMQRRQPNLPIVVLLGPEDRDFVRQLAEVTPDIRLSSPSDIGKLAATIAGANLMLCTDSAPMHLSVGVQTYTIALFGPTDPQKLLPKSDKFSGIKSPTGKMADIAPETVIQQIFG
jgi:ADP-heptose:LPS heptosyltransferase